MLKVRFVTDYRASYVISARTHSIAKIDDPHSEAHNDWCPIATADSYDNAVYFVNTISHGDFAADSCGPYPMREHGSSEVDVAFFGPDNGAAIIEGPEFMFRITKVQHLITAEEVKRVAEGNSIYSDIGASKLESIADIFGSNSNS